MSASKSKPPAKPAAGAHRPRAPQAALDALLAGDQGDPLRRAMWLDGLDRQLRPFLPPPLAAHARLANVDRGRLVFVVDSPVWHARMRLATAGVLDAARSIGLDVAAVAIKTTTQPAVPRTRPQPAAKPMSATARNGLRDALASLRKPGEAGAEDES